MICVCGRILVAEGLAGWRSPSHKGHKWEVYATMQASEYLFLPHFILQ